jgi:hypothetical protein
MCDPKPPTLESLLVQADHDNAVYAQRVAEVSAKWDEDWGHLFPSLTTAPPSPAATVVDTEHPISIPTTPEPAPAEIPVSQPEPTGVYADPLIGKPSAYHSTAAGCPPETAGEGQVEIGDLEVRPGDVFKTVKDVEDMIQEYARLHNFTVVNSKKEKSTGSGHFRGVFWCSGSNTKESHKQTATNKPTPCTFHVPYTYNKDKSILIKPASYKDAGECNNRKRCVEYSLHHNHTMFGVLNLMSALGDIITVKSMDKQLTIGERNLIGVFKGTHVGVSDIQVARAVISCTRL